MIRRLKRILGVAVLAACVLPALATSAMWLVSHVHPCGFKVSRERSTPRFWRGWLIGVASDSGELAAVASDSTIDFTTLPAVFRTAWGGRPEKWRWESWRPGAQGVGGLLHSGPKLRLGFGYENYDQLMSGAYRSGHWREWVAPWWALWLASMGVAALPAARAWRRRRRRRRRLAAGLCVVCGYDLRATPLRCPECGTPVERAAAGADSTA